MVVALQCLAGQEAKAELSAAQRAWLDASLQRLDTRFLDWVLLRDVAEKTKALGDGAIAVVAAATDGERAEGVHRIHLLGLLARLDPDLGLARLAEVVAGPDPGQTIHAAYAVGRSGAPEARITAVLGERLRLEQNGAMAGGLVLAIGHAGATSMSKLLRAQLEQGRHGTSWDRPAGALAHVAGPELEAEAASWLVADSPLLPAGLLLVRRARNTRVEEALLAMRAAVNDDQLSQWLHHSLGVCGGDATRKLLRAEWDAEAKRQAAAGRTVWSDTVDLRLLALLRLGETQALEWAKAVIADRGQGKVPGGPEFSTWCPSVADLTELLGKWKVAGAADVLAACVADQAAPCLLRAGAARGLCWLRDARGLEAAAAVLADKESRRKEVGIDEAMPEAQKTLHEFTANVDRPDYLPIPLGRRVKAIAVGQEWQRWLERQAGKVAWREPAQDFETPLFWN